MFVHSSQRDHYHAIRSGVFEYLESLREPPFGERLAYVNATRSGSLMYYPLSRTNDELGRFGRPSQLIQNLLLNQKDVVMTKNDTRCEGSFRVQETDVVSYWLQRVCPSVNLRLEIYPESDVLTPPFRCNVQHAVANRSCCAANVGFSSYSVLRVIFALLSRSGTLCLIENPEACLHPHGQTNIAELAVRAISEDLQLFIETHSDHFIDEVRIAVRKNRLSSSEIVIHYFGRKNRNATVKSLTIDQDGRIASWPPGFCDQYEKNLVRLLSPRTSDATK